MLISKLIFSRGLAKRPPRATTNDLSHARIFLHNICDNYTHQGDNEIPNIAHIREVVTEIVTVALGPINKKLDELLRLSCRVLSQVNVRALCLTDTTCSQAFNAGCGSGKHRSYEIIPFTDADGQTEQPDAVSSAFLSLDFGQC
jgi:hypothetical protein